MGKIFVIRWLAVAVCACVVATVGASSAAAAASPPGIAIGPIKVQHGFSLTLFDSSCAGKGSDLTIEFSKGGSKLSATYDYSGGPSHCRVSKTLGSGSLSGAWPGLATIKLAVEQPGKLTKPKAPPGCRGSGGSGRSAVVTGTLNVAIDQQHFGKVNLHSAPATLDKSGNYSCNAAGRSDVTVFGTLQLATISAIQPPKGRRSVFISVPGVGLPGGIKDEFELFAQGGKAVFNAPSNLDSATIGPERPYLTGSLSFTALPRCSATVAARNGSFSGVIEVHDPVLGNYGLIGSSASSAFIALGSAFPGSCNGIGSTAPAAAFTDVCSAPGTCSVSTGTNTDTFYDESTPGSETITSESWNFGDGSAPVSGPIGGQVSHTYASPGTYQVTLTITTSQNQTLTATGSSYIGS